jgi:hypothetical protein
VALRLIWISVLFALGCVQTAVENPNIVQPLSENEYAVLIKRNTSRSDQYSGFYQTFQADITILNTEVVTASLRQRGHFLQWDQRQYQNERDKVMQEAAAYSKFFMRFFSPENDYDDFHKGKTIWKVYLEYGGSRFEGKVKKMTEKFVELQTIFPHFDRFSTPYEITFNVPMTTLESGPVKVILTSSLGTAEFKFPGSK